MEKVEKHEGKNCFMVDEYMLDKVLNKIKEIIGTEKFDDTKIQVETDGKLPDNITVKDEVILVMCVAKDGEKFSFQFSFCKKLLAWGSFEAHMIGCQKKIYMLKVWVL